jgi:RimJ/RimL family protein N-acetyltransferase/carbonic anhydrase
VTRIDDILEANARYAVAFEPGEPPNPRIALVLCMDARIDPIRALGLPYGSAHIIRNAGGRVQEALRSLAISQAVIGTEEVAIIHHTECAMATLDDGDIARRLAEAGLAAPAGYAFLTFEDLEQVARDDFAAYRRSPLVRQDIPVRSFVYDVASGRLHEVQPEPTGEGRGSAAEPGSAAQEVRGTGVVLRPLRASDFPVLLAVLQEPSVARWWGHYDTQRVVEEYGDPDGVAPFAIEVGGRFAGLIQYSEEEDPDYRHASIDIALGEAYQRQGHGPDAIRTLARYLFEEGGHHRLTIDPAAHNTNAIRAYESVGFRRVGLMHQYERGADGAWHDGLLMELLAGYLM